MINMAGHSLEMKTHSQLVEEEVSLSIYNHTTWDTSKTYLRTFPGP